MLKTVELVHPIAIVGTGTIVGPEEDKGPLGGCFDISLDDNLASQESWEKAEEYMMKNAIRVAIEKAGIGYEDIDILVAGDLLNQITVSSFTAREYPAPFIGLYGACSTFCEGYAVGSLLLQVPNISTVVAVTSSHNCATERQYRYPTEYGAQPPPTAQYTVTGSGASVLMKKDQSESGPHITRVTVGRVIDKGINNPFQMGAAMAPAAADTLIRHFADTGLSPEYYDVILTGDLATVGKNVLIELLQSRGLNISPNYDDCGAMIFSSKQNVNSGGSGCACAAVVVLGHVLKKMRAGSIRRCLVTATGALLSPISYRQGETIPGIAHAVSIEWLDKGNT